MPFRMRAFAILVPALLLLSCEAIRSEAAEHDVIDVGSRKQLFVDDRFVEFARGVALVMNPPHQTGEALITADQPHEQGGLVHLYSSVLKDEDGRIRIWYDLITPTGDGPYDHERRVCYAESADGVHFTKPALGLHEVRGSTANNVVLPGVIGGCAVWMDPGAPPEHRFKTQAKVYQPTGFQMHSSPDGLRWGLFLEPHLPGPTDTQTIVFWDESIRRYALYTRERVRSEAEHYRAVRRLESDDLKSWNSEQVVFAPDEADRLTYETPTNLFPVDYYGATVFKYCGTDSQEDCAADGVYILLAQAFWHWMERGAPGTRDVRLAVSRDGKIFQRVGGWSPFLRVGPAGRFDSRQIWAMPNPVIMGDEIWIYYAGLNRNRVDPAEIDPETPGGEELGAIGRATLRLDGFVSADAGYAGGELVTPPIRFAGTRLELNLDTGGGGSVLVEILDELGAPVPGFSREDAMPLNGNSVRFPVRWGESGDVGSLAGRTIRLRFLMRDCKLYAFQFVP